MLVRPVRAHCPPSVVIPRSDCSSQCSPYGLLGARPSFNTFNSSLRLPFHPAAGKGGSGCVSSRSPLSRSCRCAAGRDDSQRAGVPADADQFRDVEMERGGSALASSSIGEAKEATEPTQAAVQPASNSIDRIERQAKASIDRLRHILYQLKTRAPRPTKTTVLSGFPGRQGPVDLDLADSSSVAKNGDLYISQNFEVELAPSSKSALSDYTSEIEGSDDDEAAFVHHDSLTCTQTSVRIDEKTHMAVINVTASVRGADVLDKDSYTERSVALAARALARTCLVLDEKAQAALHGGPSLPELLTGTQERTHDSTLRILEAGKVVSYAPAGIGTEWSPFRQLYSVKLELEGQQQEAIFKPVVPGDEYLRWQRAPADWVAYQMNLLLGLDVVPPAAIRSKLELGHKTFPLGVLVLQVEALRPLALLPAKDWGVSSPAQLVSAIHVLDALLGSAPRHARYFQAGLHWAAKEKLRPVLSQHAVGPGLGELHVMWSRRGSADGVREISETTLGRLRVLSPGLLLERLGGALTEYEMELILDRRDQVVAYFEARARRQSRAMANR